MPAVETVMDCVVAPVDQVFPELADEVSVTELPEQMVEDPLLVIVGADGVGFTVMFTAVDAGDVHPLTVLVTV